MINVIPPSAAGSAADIHAGSRSIAATHSSHMNSQMNSYGPPDLLVHSTTAPSTGWQESFDSSIVTESHYDASFESEIPPMRSSLERADTVNAAISTSATNTVNSGGPPLPTSQRKHQLLKRPSNQQVSLNKVACQNNATAVAAKGAVANATTANQPHHAVPPMTGPSGGKPPLVSSQSHHQASAASGLMLWKKVQHYVVVGGAFANAPHAAAAAAASSVPLKASTTVTTSAGFPPSTSTAVVPNKPPLQKAASATAAPPSSTSSYPPHPQTQRRPSAGLA